MFEAAMAKIDRADKHIDELAREFADFSRASPSMCQGLLRPDGKYAMCVMSPALPAAIATVLGDAINNIRSALDLVVYKLAAPAKTKFPFAKSMADMPKAIKDSGLKSGAIIAYIQHAVMPYPGGDDAFYALHVADITSKHHTLIPTVGASMVTGMDMIDGNQNELTDIACAVGGGGVVHLALSDTPFVITKQGTVHTTMYFPKESGFGDRPIVETLMALSKQVRRVIADIEGLVAQGT